MEKYIELKNTKFAYVEKKLFHGRKKIDRAIATDNLRLFFNIIKETDIKYGLIFGTLLGAIRENNFIAHDEDTDVFILHEYKDHFFELLPTLKENGLELVRYNGNLLSFMKDDEYIDIYFFKEKNKFRVKKIRTLDDSYNIPAKYMNTPIKYHFLDMDILIPNNPEKVLKILYGKNWKIPKSDSFAQPNSIRSLILKRFPFLRKIEFLKKLESALHVKS